jgi:rRNA-processing protein FCF1
VLEQFTKIIVTPCVLTEVNGFVNQLSERERKAALRLFARQISEYEEHHLRSQMLGEMDCFPRLGLTDSGILQLAANQYGVITTDAGLHAALLERGIESLNFNHLRYS